MLTPIEDGTVYAPDTLGPGSVRVVDQYLATVGPVDGRALEAAAASS